MTIRPNFLNNDQLLEILNLSKTPTAVHIGEDAIIQYANNAMLSVWGKDRSVMGLSLEQALPELKGQPFIELFAKVWREGLTISGTDTPADIVVDGKLQTYYFDFEYKAVYNEDNEVCCILHSAVDVTERVLHAKAMRFAKELSDGLEREQALNEELASSNEELNAINEELSESREQLAELNADLESKVQLRIAEVLEISKRFNRLVEQAPVAISVLRGMDLTIEIANPKILEIWAKGAAVIGLPLVKAMPELVGQPFIGILQEVMVTGIPYYGKESKAFVHRNGKLTEGYFSFIFQPLKDGDGKINSVLQVVTDVTEQVLSRLELQRTKKMMEMAIDAAKLGSWHIDPVTKNLTYNDTLARLYGYNNERKMTFDDAIGQVSKEYVGLLNTAIERALTTGGEYDVTFTQKRFDNDEVIWLRSFGKVNLSDSGKPVFSGFVMDITQAKKEEQRKNDFIGIVSHELKTPLTSLNGYLQLLQRRARKEGDEQGSEIAGSAVKQLQRMNAMINGFLDLSRLESGKMVLDKTTFRLDELLKEVAAESGIVDASHAIKFIQCDQITVFADRVKIGSVLANLLSNAVKYSPNAKLISVNCIGNDKTVKLSVSDKGIGIEAKHLSHLFDRFYRVDSRNQISGFGIGLYLSAEIIARHGGEIGVESEFGKGSTFYFSLPLD
ncbi:ATP-binding protein [Pedobacter sp. Du54]|uniref:ATP-binding protein n=1 Tax=Pedobacter anseongensis TaxID=3133439 RepID=UPI0030B71E36